MNNALVLILALISGLATFIGVLFGCAIKGGKNSIVFGTSFAAGIMILISFFELIPNGYRGIGLMSFVWVFVGVLVIWIINAILPHIHSVEEIQSCDRRCLIKMSYLLAFGMILHDFPEGFAIAGTFTISTGTGLVVVLATFIHNLPEGYIMTIASGVVKDKKIFYKMALLSALSTFLGAVLGIFLIDRFLFLSPVFLCLAAGAMIFISFHELVPASIKEKKWSYFGLGLSSSVGVYLLLMMIF